MFKTPVLLLTAGLVLSPLSCAFAQDANHVYWGQEPVVELSAKRGEIVLNGPWRFRPAAGAPVAPADASWGRIWVPGAWKGPGRLPGLISQGQGAAWAGYKNETLARAWYSRPLRIPAAWQGRAVLLDFERVSTDAVIYVNGQNCGRVRSPAGTVDITKAVTAGQDAELLVDVASTSEEKTADELLATNSEAVVNRPDEAGKELPTRGITGDVVLSSQPLGAHVSDVFVQPSVRKKQLGLQLEFAGLKQEEKVRLVAKLYDEQGKEEKHFESEVTVPAANPTVQVSWPWANPRLWDVQQPNLYTLKLEAHGAGLDDEYSQKFGFRELWIEGRKIFLNGTEFRMRPVNLLSADEWTEVGANHIAIANHIDAAMKNGFNIQEMWPNPQPRGFHRGWPAWYDVADEKGWPIIGPALPAVAYTRSNPNDWAKNQSAYRRDAEAYMRRLRNHPSVVIWGLDANTYSHGSDQSPLNIGRKGYQDKEPWYQYSIVPGMESVQAVKSLDSTRPVITHAGTYVGDIHTANNYLCLTPLQEREEWLSAWAKDGEIPYCAIEFGMPLFNTFLRDRDEFPRSIFTEPWVTEFQTIYQGSKAYKMETAGYRDQIRRRYDADHISGDQHYNDQWYTSPEAIHAPALEQLYALFITNTFRSWRTWGLSGGMVPWDLPNFWTVEPRPNVTLPPFKPGTRGTYKATMSAADFYGYGDERGGYKALPAAEAMVRNNSATLAWIAGAAPAFTAKDHHFAPGQSIQKQVVLLNDSRKTQPFSYRWQFILGGKIVASGTKSGQIETGKTEFLPLSFTAPAVPAGGKAEGTLTLDAKIGADVRQDRFAIQLYGPQPTAKAARPIQVFDPAGKTLQMLKALGIPAVAWTGQAPNGVVVIGREALSGGKAPATLPAQLEAFVRGGGRVLLLEQDPEWLRDHLGLRVAHQISRRVYSVNSIPAFQGWNAEDLRDWNGSSTIWPEQFESPKENVNGWAQYPRWGWHWGNRHGVSSGAVEKPHYGAWRPLLECEFDLAYSPLMELDYGRGRLILCTLDLEDHAAVDPAAARLARRIFQYATESTLRPRARKVVFVGGDSAALDALGVTYQKSAQLDPSADLVIVGGDAKLDDAALTAYLNRGGKVFFLPRRDEGTNLGVSTKAVQDFAGSLQVPSWPEATGLSPSDLRWRSLSGARLLQGAAEISADGLLARKAIGKGVAVFCQLDPDVLNADKYTYMRFTRWRETRAISQLLANLGASFKIDGAIFRWSSPKTISLTGSWQAKITRPLAGNAQAEDTGVSDEAKRLVATGAEDAGWQTVTVPLDWSQYGEAWAKMNGEAVFRKVIDVPADWAGKELQLDLGAVDDFDNTFFNGVEIGASGNKIPTWTLTKRYYTVPGRLVKAGKNVLTVRVWDAADGGGLKGGEGSGPAKSGPDQIQIAVSEFYHPDYRRDFGLGDDPYRYFRW